MIRLAHVSDVHVSARPLGWKPRDWFNKRTTGWMNLSLNPFWPEQRQRHLRFVGLQLHRKDDVRLAVVANARQLFRFRRHQIERRGMLRTTSIV